MSKEMILVITSSIDETASFIINKFSDRADFFRIDVDLFDQFIFSVEAGNWKITNSYGTITMNQVHSIYYRKPILPDLHSFHPQYHTMIQRDIISVVNGIVDSFNGIVLTKPSVLRKTENKVYQLICAQKYGFHMPHSYIGNSNQICMSYSSGDSIIKPITTGKIYGSNGFEIYQTSMFQKFQNDVSLTPVYLQAYIPKAYEVRATIINQMVYPVRIDTQNKIDWRADYSNHHYSLVSMPSETVEQCFQMMRDFELSFGAFDFIVTPDNHWVFLEVNPNGQWLWLEQSLNLDISDSIIRFLLQ